MRASDMVRGKDVTKGKEEKPKEAESKSFDNKYDNKTSAYQLRDMDNVNFAPLKQPDENAEIKAVTEKEETIGKTDSASEPTYVNDARMNVAMVRKPEIIKPEYRLSEFDVLDSLSLTLKDHATKGDTKNDAVDTAGLDIIKTEQPVSLDQPMKSEHPAIISVQEISVSEITVEKDTPAVVEGYKKQMEAVAQPDLISEKTRIIEPINVIKNEESFVEADTRPDDEELFFAKSATNIKELYEQAYTYLHHIQEKLKKNLPINLEPAVGIIQSIIDMHYDMDAEIYQMTVNSGSGEDYFFSHATNTAIYALRIGQRLGYSKTELLDLGLAAFICDIGMFRIPDHVLNKQGKLSNDEIDLIKSHPILSREVLMPFKDRYQAVIDAVYEHQEREDGQGYPRRLKGDEISEYAKIIGICDSYEAMTHNRPHKKALMQTESIRELIGSKNRLFSPLIIKAFLDEISIFPIGSYVRLNNRNIGCVVATNRTNPLKPSIKLLYDENGKKFAEGRIIDLKANPVLNIEGSVAYDELPK
ncbi:MAG: hypothetical protein CSYNP_01150 [Syntrophus sp. SKADARSKE-3]|nr:hypothetical protein [Syntrophus sp. SKADARSKE-3]